LFLKVYLKFLWTGVKPEREEVEAIQLQKRSMKDEMNTHDEDE
jgi:hypothetical protein